MGRVLQLNVGFLEGSGWTCFDGQHIAGLQIAGCFKFEPAGIQGNLYFPDLPGKDVLGYFEVAGVDIARTYTLPETMKPLRFLNECLPWYVRYDYRNLDDICCYCSAIEGYTYERPDYWGMD